MLGIGACGGNGSLGDQPVLSGQFQNWDKGAGYTLQATIATSTAMNMTLSSAPIDASGNFSITLPGAAALAPYLQEQHLDPSKPIPGCTSVDLHISPQDVAAAILVLKAVNGSSTLNVDYNDGLAPATNVVTYTYVDRDIDETGNVSCTINTTSFAESINIHFGTGWNAELLSSAGSNITVTSGTVPDSVKWFAR